MQNSLPLGNNGNNTKFSHSINDTKIEHREIEVFIGELETFDIILKKFDWINFELISEENYVPDKNGTFANMIGSVKSTLNKDFEFTFKLNSRIFLNQNLSGRVITVVGGPTSWDSFFEF